MSTEHLLGDISLVLEGLIGADNSARQQAEARLNELLVESSANLLLLLAQVGALGVGGFQLDQRLLALILLRRKAFAEHPGIFLNEQERKPSAPFDVMPEATRGRIETVLGTGLEDEMDVRLRKGLGVCVGEWVKASEKRQRPFHNLPDILLGLVASPRPFHRFTPFQLLDTAPTLFSNSTLTGQAIPGQKVAELLLSGLSDPSIDVRVEALRATRGVIIQGLDAKERDMYGPGLVAAAFEIIPDFPPTVLEHAIEPMIDVASSFPHLFTECLEAAVPFLVQCLAPPDSLPDHSFSRYAHLQMEWDQWYGMANMAFEVLSSLMIADPDSTQQWEDGHLVDDVVRSIIGRQVAAFTIEGDTLEEWTEREDLDEDDETYPAYPEEMLSRFSQVMNDGPVLQAVAQESSRLLQRSEWQAKYCSLMAISSVSEGCYEAMKQEARSILQLIAPCSTHENARVRYGFLYCLGKLCTNLEGVLQREYADPTLDVILRLLDDPVARVRSAAAAALVHFFQLEELPSFEARLKPILQSLVTSLQKGPLYVQEEVLAAIAAVASQAGKSFKPYYRDIMDFCLRVLTTPSHTSHEKLIGVAMRCAALLGQAVGKEQFFPDAVPLCQALLTHQNHITTPEDKRRGPLSEAWSIIAPILGRDFVPFLQFVIPPVLKAASYLPEHNGGDEEDEYDQFQTAEMVEKEEAFVQLSVYVHEMRAGYAPYLSETMSVAMAAIHSPMSSEGVQEAACFLVPGLLQVAKDANIWVGDATNLQTLFRTLINGIPLAVEASAVGQLYQSIGDSLRVLETPLPEANLAHLVRSTHQWLAGVYERRLERRAELKSNRGRGDYWIWAETEQYEQAAEDEALHCMDTTFGRVVRHNSAALGAMAQTVQLAQQVKAAAVNWPRA